MKKIVCIAVDDEPLALQNMKIYISQVETLSLAGAFSKPLEAVTFLNENHTDLVFLDIEMDLLTGIQLLDSLTYKPAVILTTAYNKYAIKGYEYDVVDYLLKPFSFERFLKAVNKASDRLGKSPAINPLNKSENSDPNKEFLFIRTNYQMEKVMLKNILYIKSMNNYLIIKTPDKSYFTISNFRQMIDLLPCNNFVRLHKSYIVALDKIDIINKNSVRLGKTTISIGESFKEKFFSTLEKNGLI